MSNSQISFSSKVKDELVKRIPEKRHCRIAEIAVLIAAYGKIRENSLLFMCDNEKIAQKYFTLLKKTFNIFADAFENKGFFAVEVKKQEDIVIILQAVKIMNPRLEIQNYKGIVSDVLVKNTCCRQSYISSIFLCFGTIIDPSKGASLEFAFDKEAYAKQVKDVLESLGLNAKISIRKNRYYIVYVRGVKPVGDFLRIGAPNATMEFENAMIVREIANRTNRFNNCDVANSQKAIMAAYKQIEDIRYLYERVGESNLPETLRCVAKARLDNPEVGLKELGELMEPPLGKSGVNHRLRKISEMAQEYREKNE